MSPWTVLAANLLLIAVGLYVALVIYLWPDQEQP